MSGLGGVLFGEDDVIGTQVLAGGGSPSFPETNKSLGLLKNFDPDDYNILSMCSLPIDNQRGIMDMGDLADGLCN